jgi:hypothetical protein
VLSELRTDHAIRSMLIKETRRLASERLGAAHLVHLPKQPSICGETKSPSTKSVNKLARVPALQQQLWLLLWLATGRIVQCRRSRALMSALSPIVLQNLDAFSNGAHPRVLSRSAFGSADESVAAEMHGRRRLTQRYAGQAAAIACQ